MENRHQDTELRRLEIVAQRIAESHIDITKNYGDWIDVAMGCSSLGEPARAAFHLISANYPEYNKEECDRKFSNCLVSGRGLVTLGTVFEMAKRAGIDTRMPKGRPAIKEKDKRKNAEDLMKAQEEALLRYGKYRFNVWTQRPEILEKEKWRPINDRDLCTFTCRLMREGLRVNERQVKTMLYNTDFVKDVDVVVEYLESLKPWNPDTDPDYIREFFVGHLEFGDAENKEFYDMVFRKWFTSMVALWLGIIEENPTAPIFVGHQHIGKTWFVKNILPKALRDYLYCVNPVAKVDKDFSISLSEVPMMFLDEFSFGGSQKNDAYKYVTTSGRSNERDSYHQFREWRNRRVSIIGATNNIRFIKDLEGVRRFPAINLVGTKNLNEFPLPYEGAYAQALYLVRNGYPCKPDWKESMQITEHNIDYLEPNDCEEAICTFFPKAEGCEESAAFMSSSEIQQELSIMSLRGKSFGTVEIGRVLSRHGYNKRKIGGIYKYLVIKKSFESLKRQNEETLRSYRKEIGYLTDEDDFI